MDKLRDEHKVNILKEVQDKHQQDHSLRLCNWKLCVSWKMACNTSWHDIKLQYYVHYRSSSKENFLPKLIFSSKHLEMSQESNMCWWSEREFDYTTKCHCKHHCNISEHQQCTERKIQAQHYFLDKLLLLMQDIYTVTVIHARWEGASETVR